MAFQVLKAVIVGSRKGYILPRESEEDDGMELIQFQGYEELIPSTEIHYDPENEDGFL